jgi:hypothetical protein
MPGWMLPDPDRERPSMLLRAAIRLCLVFALVLVGSVAATAAPSGHWQAVLVAGDIAQPVFDNAARAMGLWLAERGIAAADIHRLNASAGPRNPVSEPATLGQVLNRISGLNSRPGDNCFVFITSHGAPSRGIFLARDDEMLQPAALARALVSGCGTVPTVVIVSGCYSGSFTRGIMAAPNRIVMTAARADRPSFGCAADRTYTVFDACLLGALPHAATWRAVFAETKECVEERERELKAEPSHPQAYFGTAVRDLPVRF